MHMLESYHSSVSVCSSHCITDILHSTLDIDTVIIKFEKYHEMEGMANKSNIFSKIELFQDAPNRRHTQKCVRSNSTGL